MKRKIRANVFETNSSSQHSLCIMKKDEHYTQEEILKDFPLFHDETNYEWHIWDSDLEFGRSPFRALGSFRDKWLYACASLVEEYNDCIYKELEAIAFKYVPILKEIVIPITFECIADKEHESNKDSSYAQKYGMTEEEFFEYLDKKEKEWGIEITYYETDEGDFRFTVPYTGYVGENILGSFLETEKISLEEYLTNKKYVVIQDGDEYGYFGDMKRSGLINLAAIDYEYPEAY